MPIPTPNPGEPAKQFLNRCMSNPTMVREYPNLSQRFAICNTQLRRRKIEDEIERRNLSIEELKLMFKNVKKMEIKE